MAQTHVAYKLYRHIKIDLVDDITRNDAAVGTFQKFTLPDALF